MGTFLFFIEAGAFNLPRFSNVKVARQAELFVATPNPGSSGTTIDRPRAIAEQIDCASMVQSE